jgi:hypothetical protein
MKTAFSGNFFEIFVEKTKTLVDLNVSFNHSKPKQEIPINPVNFRVGLTSELGSRLSWHTPELASNPNKSEWTVRFTEKN